MDRYEDLERSLDSHRAEEQDAAAAEVADRLRQRGIAVTGGEGLGLRTILGTMFVLISVVVITTTRANQPAVALPVGGAAEAAR